MANTGLWVALAGHVPHLAIEALRTLPAAVLLWTWKGRGAHGYLSVGLAYSWMR